MCNMACVTCHVSFVICHMAHASCHLSLMPTDTATYPFLANFPTMYSRLAICKDPKTQTNFKTHIFLTNSENEI